MLNQQPADSACHQVSILLLQVEETTNKNGNGKEKRKWMLCTCMDQSVQNEFPVLFWHDIPKSSQVSWIRAISWYHNDNASIAEKLLPEEARKDMTQKNLASTRIEHIFLVLTTSIPSVSRSLMVSATHHHQTH